MNVKKMPKFLVLHNSTSYGYVGNLTFESLEEIIISKKFIEIAREAEIQKDLEGITLDNFAYHPSQPIQRRWPLDEGWKINGVKALTKNYNQMIFGIKLLAKTYGIRRIVPSDEYIGVVTMFIFMSPFLAFIGSILWTLRQKKLRKAILEKNKQKLLKNKKD